jgi:DNA-binding response OmpR family regulator
MANQADKSVASKRLLIVEDEPTVRDALQRVLRVEGFEVRVASNGREALEQLHKEAIALILLDINVADENGWELCRRMRAEKPDLRVIAMTARPDQAAAALAADADALMEKPLDLPVLLDTVRRLSAAPRRRPKEVVAGSRVP